MSNNRTSASLSAAGPRAALWLLLLTSAILSGCGESPTPGTVNTPVRPEQTYAFDAARTDSLRTFTAEFTRQIEQNLVNAHTSVLALRTAVKALLDTPDPITLEAARDAWLNAHDAWEGTTLDRYFANLALPEAQALALFQLRYQLNQWPILPGYLDSFAGYQNSGIVNDATVELTPLTLRQQHGEFDLSEATLGFHVIEFLLWGTNADGASLRPPEDYVAVTELASTQTADGIVLLQIPANRRRQLLALVTDLLVGDVETMQRLWIENSAGVRARVATMEADSLLSLLMTSMTDMLTEELLVSALYPMLNGDFTESIHSPYSHSTQNAVSAQLSGLDRLLLESHNDEGVTLDSLINALSDNFTDFFYQNFDASKECLVVLFSTLEVPESSASALQAEFDIVECINLVSNMVDHLSQVRASLY